MAPTVHILRELARRLLRLSSRADVVAHLELRYGLTHADAANIVASIRSSEITR